MYPLGLLARAPHKCDEQLFERGLCVASYLNGTSHYTTSRVRLVGLTLEACSDASHEERGATAGSISCLAGAGISAMSKMQRCATLSTCESETVSASVCAELIDAERASGGLACIERAIDDGAYLLDEAEAGCVEPTQRKGAAKTTTLASESDGGASSIFAGALSIGGVVNQWASTMFPQASDAGLTSASPWQKTLAKAREMLAKSPEGAMGGRLQRLPGFGRAYTNAIELAASSLSDEQFVHGIDFVHRLCDDHVIQRAYHSTASKYHSMSAVLENTAQRLLALPVLATLAPEQQERARAAAACYTQLGNTSVVRPL